MVLKAMEAQLKALTKVAATKAQENKENIVPV